MRHPRFTYTASAVALAVGGLCCWWMLRAHEAAVSSRVGASTTNATLPRPAKRRRADAIDETPSQEDTTNSDVSPPPPAGPPGHVRLHVVGLDDQKPIPGAQVVVAFIPDAKSVMTDADGDARLDVPAAKSDDNADRVWIRVEAEDFVREDVGVHVASGEEHCETVAMRPGFYVSGFVHEPDGTPIAGAHVVARDGMYDVTPRPEVADATSGADGRFRVGALPIHFFVEFEITAPRHAVAHRDREKHDTSPFDVTLDPAGRIHVVVWTSDGKPAANARVGAGAGDEAEGASGSTGDDGTIDLDGLAFGCAWTVSASHDEFMDSVDSPAIRLDAAHADASCELALRPVGHVEVDLDFAVPHEPSWAKLHAPTGVELCAVPGRATFVVRKSGTWHLEADKQGFAPVSVDAEIAPGETRMFHLRFEEGASISGIVVDDVGATIPDAVVDVDVGNLWMRQGFSAAGGGFRVTGLLPGKHSVRGFAGFHATIELADVAVPGEGLRVVLPRFGEASVRLVLPAGAPTPTKWEVSWKGETVERPDLWKQPEIVRRLPPGDASLSIDVDGYSAIWRDFVVAPGSRTDLGDVVLDPGFDVTGRVVDAAGEPIAGVDVLIAPCPNGWAKTDHRGAFVAEHVSPGDHEVRVVSELFADTPVKCVVGKDTSVVVLQLTRLAVVHLTIRNADRKTLRGLYVQIEDDAGQRVTDVAEPDEAGQAKLRVRTGKWRVVVRRQEDGAEVAHGDVDVTSGKDASIEIAVPK